VLGASAPLEFSALLNSAWKQHQRLELETDSIAAHTLTLDRPPAAQFIDEGAPERGCETRRHDRIGGV
jgi:hypothetical protein